MSTISIKLLLTIFERCTRSSGIRRGGAQLMRKCADLLKESMYTRRIRIPMVWSGRYFARQHRGSRPGHPKHMNLNSRLKESIKMAGTDTKNHTSGHEARSPHGQNTEQRPTQHMHSALDPLYKTQASDSTRPKYHHVAGNSCRQTGAYTREASHHLNRNFEEIKQGKDSKIRWHDPCRSWLSCWSGT